MTIHNDFAAFRRKLGASAVYETREATDTKKLTETIEGIHIAFEELKKANDERFSEIKKQGQASPETEAKLAKIDTVISDLSDLKKRLEEAETRSARAGAGLIGGEQRNLSPAETENRSAFLNWVRDPLDNDRQSELKRSEGALERRAVDTLTGAAGGFAVPEVIAREIARLSVDISPMRQVARVVTSGTADYKELVDVGGTEFGWAGETDARPETGSPGLFEVAPTFGMAYAYPKASEESLQDIFFNVEDWLISSASETIAKGEGAAFISGNGTKKPTGFLAGPAPLATADATRAFGTLQFVASGGAAAMPTSPDKFLDIVYALRAKYRGNARWMTSKIVLSDLRKYKDSDGQYLWQPALAAGQPERFLGYPVVEAEDMPAVAANAFPLAFGDFGEGYLIVDIAGMRMTRDEITTPGYLKFYVRKRVGGKIKNSEAIKLLKIAA